MPTEHSPEVKVDIGRVLRGAMKVVIRRQNRLRLSARAVLHVLAGDAASAQAEMQKARELVEPKLREQPEDADSSRS